MDAAAGQEWLGRLAPAASTKAGVMTHGGMIEIIVADDRVSAWATDLELGVISEAPAAVITPGTVVVSYDTLGAVVAQLEGMARFRATGKELRVIAAGVNASARTMPADLAGVPSRPTFVTSGIVMDAAALAGGLDRVESNADAPSNKRPVLTGVRFAVESSRLTLWAGDGYRAALVVAGPITPAEDADWPERGALPPARCARVLARMLVKTAAETTVRLVASESWIACVGPGWQWCSRLLDGEFPNLRCSLPPADSDLTTITINVAAALAATRFASIAAQRDGSMRTLKLATRPDRLLIMGDSPDHGSSARAIAATVRGDHLIFSLNGAYLLDALTPISAETVTLGLRGQNRVVVIRETDTDNAWLVMPIVKETAFAPVNWPDDEGLDAGPVVARGAAR